MRSQVHYGLPVLALVLGTDPLPLSALRSDRGTFPQASLGGHIRERPIQSPATKKRQSPSALIPVRQPA